ncbi:MAG: sulfotransferase family protein [Pseudomonadota bacterium]
MAGNPTPHDADQVPASGIAGRALGDIEPRRPNEIKKLFLRALCLRRGYRAKVVISNEHLCLFPRLGILLNRVKKSGNTTAAAFLNDLSHGNAASAGEGFKADLLTPPKMPYSTLLELDRFYSVAVVRNPFARALSTFRNKLEGGLGRRYGAMPGHGVAGPEGFRAFLRFLEEGGIDANRHFWRQVDLLFQPVGRFSRIARLETLSEDFAAMLDERGLDPGPAATLTAPHAVEQGAGKLTGAASKLQVYYDDECTAIVARLYRADFEAFHYDTEVLRSR